MSLGVFSRLGLCNSQSGRLACVVRTVVSSAREPENVQKFRHPNWPTSVKIVEVGPRDGLQNENNFVKTEHKIRMINRLSQTGLRAVEVTSFVSRRWVPQLSDAAEVFGSIQKADGVSYPVLVPNDKGLTAAIEAGVKEVAVFTAASEQFVTRNTNMTITESLRVYTDLCKRAKEHDILVRGYVSTVISCPYKGLVDARQVTDVAEELISMGCYEVSLGDTVGAGTPGEWRRLLSTILTKIPADRLAVHCHDTYGQALANIATALEFGISTVDSSVAGLGGCPYAPGATGNVATEDVVFMLHGMGIPTGVNLLELMKISKYISSTVLERKTNSKVTQAFPATDKGLN